MVKTYNVDYTVADSAGTATAYLSGVKTNKGVIGVNGNIKRKDQDCENILRNRVNSVFTHAIASGKSTGIVTTTRLTDATPSGAYAHVSDRDYEGSSPITDPRCKDIARQLIEDSPGSEFNVILGGGTRYFQSPPLGERKDGRNLFDQWRESKRSRNLTDTQFRLVQTRQELAQVNKNTVKYLFGSFSQSHLLYDQQRLQSNTTTEPSIVEMTEAAINVLQNNDKGFFLLVEGGKIDKAHHENQAFLALYDTLAFDRAINRALNMINLMETLVIVTADHSHGFTLNGYAKRDSNIFGFAEKKSNGTAYTSLMYATGPGNRAKANETIQETADMNYRQMSTVWLDSASHGGEDVAAYAIGAMSHLMRSTQEQTYVAHLMTFAACIGPYQQETHCKSSALGMLIGENTKNLIVVCGLVLALLNHWNR